MLYLTCTTITSVDLAHYGVSGAKDWVPVNCGTRPYISRRLGALVTIFRELGSMLLIWGIWGTLSECDFLT